MNAPDLTRWNRAGLRSFIYIDGNAADYLERLRARMQTSFPQWERVLSNHGGSSDEEAERLKRALSNYHAARDDWAWEILRTFARASHVLAGHIDAYANEGFLETATQWDNLRRLVEMLDYHPAPPSSASTPLVLSAKTARQGLVSKGFQVKYTPPLGGAPVVFETLEDITVDAVLNELRLENWNRSPQYWDPFTCQDQALASAWVVPEKVMVSVGDVAVLLKTSQANDGVSMAVACRVLTLNRDTGGLCLQRPDSMPKQAVPPLSVSNTSANVANTISALGVSPTPANPLAGILSLWQKGYSQLLLAPKKVYVPQLNGPNVVRCDKPHGLAENEVICWPQVPGDWQFNRVVAIDDMSLRLADSSVLPNGLVYKALETPSMVNPDTGVKEYRVTLKTLDAVYLAADGSLNSLDMSAHFTMEPVGGEIAFYKLNAEVSDKVLRLYITIADVPAIATVLAVGVSTYRFNGTPGDLQSGDWVVAEFGYNDKQAKLQALNIQRIDELEDEFEVVFTGDNSSAAEVTLAATNQTSLATIEMVLDQDVFNNLSFLEFSSGSIARRNVRVIQGIGNRYAQAFASAGIESIAQLAGLDVTRPISGISPVRRREFKAKAQLVLGYASQLIQGSTTTDTTLSQMASQALLVRVTLPMRRLYGPFKASIKPLGHDINSQSISGDKLLLEAKHSNIANQLNQGRTVLLQQAGTNTSNPKLAVVKSVKGRTIDLQQSINTEDGFTVGNTRIHANVISAGHGAYKGEKVLGSGDATRLAQSFILKVNSIAFVADSTMPSGVRADIQLRVDDRTWQQVSSLRDSGPADPHYTVRMTEQGYLNIGFGDGENGRRLPSGINNIRVAYRVGSGLAGNVPPHGLQKPVKPHKLLAAVDQPVAATGGNDMEGTASLRSNAPASLLTLERAVSLNDFANLAVSQSSVWQARAFDQATMLGRQVNIRVVIIPAGGATLDKDYNAIVPKTFLDKQVEFLTAHSQPGIQVSVFAFQPLLVSATVKIRMKFEEYDPDTVKQMVYNAVLQALSLKHRKLGQPLYRSELYNIVESVTGVENSDCRLQLVAGMEDRAQRVNTQSLNGDSIIRSIQPKEAQVIYLDPDYSNLLVSAEEFEL